MSDNSEKYTTALRVRAQHYFDFRARAFAEKELFSHVQLGEAIASGGFAVVYDGVYRVNPLGKDPPEHGVRVAAKIFRPEFIDSKDPVGSEIARIRFTRETAGTELLVGSYKKKYPQSSVPLSQILRYDLVPRTADHDAVWYILTTHEEGVSVKDLVSTELPDVKQVGLIGSPIAETLEFIHSRGLVHRDVKPSNIHVRPDGSPVLFDFGLAKPSEEYGGSPSPWLAGTPAYLPPEVVCAKKLVPTPENDVYSFGALCHYMLAGSDPYSNILRRVPGSTAVPDVHRGRDPHPKDDGVVPSEELAFRPYRELYLRNKPPTEIGVLRPELLSSVPGRKLEEVVNASLAIDPSSRPAMRDLAAALRGVSNPKSRRRLWAFFGQ